jgi:NAD-dependent deacetylase
MKDLIKQTAQIIANGKYIVALTGAGISVESGIPPFRGKGGLWEKFDPMEYAHIDVFMKDPQKVWQVLFKDLKSVVGKSKPNAAHQGLARLEKLGKLKTVITQNVDGLHQKAGNTDVVEFHGNLTEYQCLTCGAFRNIDELDLNQMPPRCNCGGIYRPNCIFFGEAIPPENIRRSQEAATECDIMLVVGTSAIVQPAAFMPIAAKQSGAIIIEINPETTPLTQQTSDYFIKGKAGEIIRRLVDETETLIFDLK